MSVSAGDEVLKMELQKQGYEFRQQMSQTNHPSTEMLTHYVIKDGWSYPSEKLTHCIKAAETHFRERREFQLLRMAIIEIDAIARRRDYSPLEKLEAIEEQASYFIRGDRERG